MSLCATYRMSSVRQRRLIGFQLVARWSLIVSNWLGENKPITSLKLETAIVMPEGMCEQGKGKSSSRSG
jgi:hypothetical protein